MQQVGLTERSVGGGGEVGAEASHEYKLATHVNIMGGLKPQESKLQTLCLKNLNIFLFTFLNQHRLQKYKSKCTIFIHVLRF
jgi:hypothetical protein